MLRESSSPTQTPSSKSGWSLGVVSDSRRTITKCRNAIPVRKSSKLRTSCNRRSTRCLRWVRGSGSFVGPKNPHCYIPHARFLGTLGNPSPIKFCIAGFPDEHSSFPQVRCVCHSTTPARGSRLRFYHRADSPRFILHVIYRFSRNR